VKSAIVMKIFYYQTDDTQQHRPCPCRENIAMSTMSSQASSRWGPIKTENIVEGTNEQQMIGNGRKEDETEAAAIFAAPFR
jgi:hypothetical protein